MGVKLQSALGGSVELNAPSTASTYSIAVPAGNGTMAMTSSLTGFKNKLLNGDFRIWQRGTSFVSTTDWYKADRWAIFRETGVQTKSVVRISILGEIPGFQYACRVQRNSGNTDASNGIWLLQNLESADCIPFQGKELTISFWARKGANYSATSSNLISSVVTGTGTDQAFNAGWTGQGEVGYNTFALTTTWQRFSYTFTVPTTATQFKPTFRFYPTGTAGANDYYDITGIQMEVGPVATDFESRPIGQELAMCQRFFEKSFEMDFAPANGANSTSLSGNGAVCCVTWNIMAGGFIGFAVQKRGVPTVVRYGNNSGWWNGATAAGGVGQWSGSTASLSPTHKGLVIDQQIVDRSAIPVMGHYTADADF